MVLLKDIEKLYNEFSKAAYKPGHLDAKVKELIAFSNSVAINCGHCMRAHYKKAVEAGASPEEIAESIAIAMTVSAGMRRAYARDVIEEFKKNDQ